jgi:hypothetical protein
VQYLDTVACSTYLDTVACSTYLDTVACRKYLDTVACRKYLGTVAGAPRFHVFINFFRYKEHAKRDDEEVLTLTGEMARYVEAVHV